MECLLPYLCMVTVPHIMVGLERMLDYRGVGLARFHCIESFSKGMGLPLSIDMNLIWQTTEHTTYVWYFNFAYMRDVGFTW